MSTLDPDRTREPLARRVAAWLLASSSGPAEVLARGDALLAGAVGAIARERGLDRSSVVESLRDGALERGQGVPPTRLLEELVSISRAEGADGALGLVHEATLDALDGIAAEGASVRRARGAHFTPRALSGPVVARALELLGEARVPEATACDPACGAGAFLCETLRRVAGPGASTSSRREIASRLAGIDRDPRAVRAARLALWLEVGDPSLPLELAGRLEVGDALLEVDERGTRPAPAWGARLGREGGFDLVLGNPPFLGGKRLRTVHGDAYAEALVRMHAGATKNVDLCAHFLLRGHDALADRGVLGFVVTNTIAQGATRRGGLGMLVERGARIVSAERRVPWPGAAGVVVSTIHLAKGEVASGTRLDGREVGSIDAFLSAGDRRAPPRIASQRGRAFIGCFLRGAGFVIDDGDLRAVPSAELARVLQIDPRSAEVVRPFLGGEEVVKHPDHRPHRRVISFGSMSEAEARAYPGAFAIVERHVRPVREALGGSAADRAHKAAWWRFANPRPELASAISALDRVIVVPRLSAHLVAVRIPNDAVYSDQLVVFASDSPALLAILSSRIHELWARAMCSTLGDGLRYVPTDAFETFPFPRGGYDAALDDPTLVAAGERFERARREALEGSRLGITKLLGKLHDPREVGEPLDRLRDAWAEVDRAVAHAYGWSDDVVRARYVPDARGRIRLALDADRAEALLARLDVLAQARV